jgi:hypothetical protein
MKTTYVHLCVEQLVTGNVSGSGFGIFSTLVAQNSECEALVDYRTESSMTISYGGRMNHIQLGLKTSASAGARIQ